jgi:tetratricopeptide (TPR) repeat protein
LQQGLDILEGVATGAAREALVALRVTKLAREGNNKSAVELGNEELQKSSGESPVLACATASAALMDGSASAAMNALRKAPSNEPMALALHWMALTVTGNDAQLSREVVRNAISLPTDYHGPLSTMILAALARSSTTFDGQLPAWLKPNDDDANGLYAQGLVFLHRRAAEEAVTSFERALRIDSKLQALGDAPDVARLLVAIKKFAVGDSKATRKMLEALKSPRLQPLAERLELLTVLMNRRRSAIRRSTSRV